MSEATALKEHISTFFKVAIAEIADWEKIKASNSVCSFRVNGDKYFVRKLLQKNHLDIHRSAQRERAAYDAIAGLGISEEVLDIDANGIKISKDVGGKALGADCYKEKYQKQSIEVLRQFHHSGIAIPYPYDIFGHIEGYAKKCDTAHAQNLKTLENYKSDIVLLKANLAEMNVIPVLCHGDACVSSNFLRLEDGSLRLIDWEWAGMADPFLDLAIAAYNQWPNIEPEKSLEWYLQRKPRDSEIFRLYAYIALFAFVWAAWEINNTGAFEGNLELAEEYLRKAGEIGGLG